MRQSIKIQTPSFLIDMVYRNGDVFRQQADQALSQIMFCLISYAKDVLYQRVDVTTETKAQILYSALGRQFFEMNQNDIVAFTTLVDPSIAELLSVLVLSGTVDMVIDTVISSNFLTEVIFCDLSHLKE